MELPRTIVRRVVFPIRNDRHEVAAEARSLNPRGQGKCINRKRHIVRYGNGVSTSVELKGIARIT